MEIRYDHRFSLEETVAQIAQLEQYVGEGNVPFTEHETVIDLQYAMRNRVAYSASELMTGARMHSEREKYLESYAGYRRLLGAVALDAAYREYDESTDMDKVKRRVKKIIKTSDLEMVAQDYYKRLSRSPIERTKQRIAQSDKARTLVPFTLSKGGGLVGVAATAMFLKQSEVPSLSSIELTPTQTGLAAAATVAAGLSIRPAIRGVTKQLGSVVGNQVGDSFFRYVLDKFDEDEEDENKEDLEKIIGRYAMRDLESQLDKTGNCILDFEAEGREDLGPMVAKALDVNEAATHRHYAVDPVNEWHEEWYLRWPSKLTRIDFRNYRK